MPRFIYTALLFVLLPFVPIKLLWRGIKQPAYLNHWPERFGFYTTPASKNIIWLHCVSVGETRAAAPLVDALEAAYPNHQILLTHTTPTGRETSEQLFGNRVQRVYLPYDVPFAINRFLAHFKPTVGALIETELWFNLIAASKCAQVPLLLLNARLSQKSANGYAKLGSLVKNGLQDLSAVVAQTEADAARLQALGAREVVIAGNLKFDVKPPADNQEKGLALRKLMGEARTIFLAASTRDGEEALILDAIKDLDVLTVIVPRHPQRFGEVAALLTARGINFERKSRLSTTALKANNHAGFPVKVILGDTMGELFTYYAACDFAFIGGSLLPLGGQNLIEAASLGKPILVGPHTFNFAEATKNAIESGAAILVEDSQTLGEAIKQLQSNPTKRAAMQHAAHNFYQASAGATERLLPFITRYLN